MPGLSGSCWGSSWGRRGFCVGWREASRDSQWTARCLHPAPQNPQRAGESNPTLVRRVYRPMLLILHAITKKGITLHNAAQKAWHVTWGLVHAASPLSSHLCFSIQGGEPKDCRHLPVQKSRVLGFYHLYRPLRPKHEPAGGQLPNFTCLRSHCSSVWG